MHPNAAFQARHDDKALAHVTETGFAHVFLAADDRLLVAHVPIIVDDGALWFHLANSNAMTPLLDGRRALASIAGTGSYISANWYGAPAEMVPTWNYRASEIEGSVRRLDTAALEVLLHKAAAHFEPLAGEDWTMNRMERSRAEAMMRGITGFRLQADIIRHTNKASQNRNDADAKRLVAALERCGDIAGASQIRQARGW